MRDQPLGGVCARLGLGGDLDICLLRRSVGKGDPARGGVVSPLIFCRSNEVVGWLDDGCLVVLPSSDLSEFFLMGSVSPFAWMLFLLTPPRRLRAPGLASGSIGLEDSFWALASLLRLRLCFLREFSKS